MFPWVFNIYMGTLMNEGKLGMVRRGESGGCLTSCMQMTWFCVENLRKT